MQCIHSSLGKIGSYQVFTEITYVPTLTWQIRHSLTQNDHSQIGQDGENNHTPHLSSSNSLHRSERSKTVNRPRSPQSPNLLAEVSHTATQDLRSSKIDAIKLHFKTMGTGNDGECVFMKMMIFLKQRSPKHKIYHTKQL